MSLTDSIYTAIWWFVSGWIVFRIAKCVSVLSRSFYGHVIQKQYDLTPLLDKWTVVTGCTDGIGKAYVQELAKSRGIRKFFLIARNEKKVNEFADELKKNHNCEIKIGIFDFANDDYSKLPQELNTLDVGILINCVGIAPEAVGSLVELPEGIGSKIIRVNLMSCVKMTELILPGMVKRNRGIIVNFSSLTGWRPLPYMSAYPATKAAISFYSEALADEFAHTNVKINCLIPCLVATKIASYESSEANDIFVIRTDTFAKYAVRLIGNERLSTGSPMHDIQCALIVLISYWVFKQVFVPFVMLGVHKKRVQDYQTKSKKD